MMATINIKHVDKATNNNKEHVETTLPENTNGHDAPFVLLYA